MPQVASVMKNGKMESCELSKETYEILNKLVRKKLIGFQDTLTKAWECYGVSEEAVIKYIRRRYPVYWYFLPKKSDTL